MKNKILFSLAPAALLLLAPAGPAHARGALEVRAVSPPLVEAEAGEIVTLSFRVANHAGDEAHLRERFTLPGGWRTLMPPLDFRLGAGRETTRLLAVQVPREAAAGDYEIIFGAASGTDYALSDSAGVTVSIRPSWELELFLEDRAPETVVAGDSFRFAARLVNRGNAALRVEMEGRLPGAGEALVSPGSFRLEPGASVRLEVTARPDPGVTRLRRQHLRLIALGDREIDGRPVSARLSIPFDLVPLVSGEDPFRRYPAEFTTRLAGDGDDYGLQFTLRGDGWLDEARTRRLDFRFQAPDRHGKGVLGRRDEYRLRYREPGWTLRAGDTSFALSPLTSWYRYGRGLGIELHPPESALGAGLYHVRDRWRLQERRDTGFFASFAPGPETRYRLNFLALDHEPWRADPGGRENILGIQGDFQPRGGDRLATEIAFSESARADGATGGAWRLEYRNRPRETTRYSLAARRSGPDFSGRYGDSASGAASISFPLSEALRGDLSFRHYARNLDKAEDRGTAGRENLYRAGLRWRLPSRWRLNLGYDYHDRADALPAPAYEVREHGLRLGAGRAAGAFSYRAEARRAWTEDLLAGSSYGGTNYSVNATWSPDRSLRLNLRGSFGDDESPGESRLLRRGRSLGGSLNWRPAPDLSFNFHYSRYDLEYPDEPLRERTERDHYGAALSWHLPGGQRLELGARRSEANDRETANYYHASLAIPFGVSLGRRQSVGSLEGRVYLADEPGQPGIPGAVVLVDGTAAVTGPDGRFLFRTLAPGEYEVRVEELSVGLGLVPANDRSRSVNVTGGETAALEIGLARTGSVAGRILFEPAGNDYNNNLNNNTAGGPPNNNNNFVSGGGNNNDANDGNGNGNGTGNILVEMSREGETRRTLSDSRGAFLFERLRPGEWTLRVYPHNLPAFHEVDALERPVTVAPGEQAEVTVRVTPRRREIRFIDEGRIGTNNDE